MEPDRIWQVVTNPAWRPITDNDTPGYVLLLGAAAALVALTIWTYTGSSASTPKRVGTLIALRLIALLINLTAVVWLIWSKRLFGVRGGGPAYRAEHATESLLSVERAAVAGRA